MADKNYTFEELLDIIERLRGENGCPWDRVQTHETLKRNLIEETYEALEALDSGDKDKFADELGDLLLQIVFHASIGRSEGTFTIQDVLNHICNKMISRHTHIFGRDSFDTPDEVLDNWDKIKVKEKGLQSHTDAMHDVCTYLPALIRAEKVQKKAAKAGFDWDDPADALEKVEEELAEWKKALANSDADEMRGELGDVLFAVVNASRGYKLDAEEALTGATRKFIHRFAYVEESALAQGKRLEDMPLAEMDALWDEAKKKGINR